MSSSRGADLGPCAELARSCGRHTLVYIPEVLGSNTGHNTDHTDPDSCVFPQCLQAKVSTLPTRHYLSLSHPYPFIVRQSAYNSALRTLSY
jgi:hypothetical protein